MLKRLRKAHPILFCVLAEVVFLASLFVTDLVFTIALVLFRADFASIDTYLYSTLQELVGAMVAVLFLVRTDRAGLLRRRGSGFFNGLLVGMYPLVFIGYNAFGSLVLGRPENGVLQPAARICTFLVSMAWWVWPRNSSSAVSLPRPCWSTLAPAAPVCGRPAFCPVCCLVRRT